MKRALIFFSAAILLISCGKKSTDSASQTDSIAASAAMAEYQALSDSINALFEDETMDDATADAIFYSIIDRYLELAEANPKTDVCYATLKDAYYYFSTDQKKRMFALVDEDTLRARNMERLLVAYKAECNTAVGMHYTDFGAVTPAGDSLYLHNLVDGEHWVFVDFWASWCGPCRRSMPALKELKELAEDELVIVGVSLDNDHKARTGCIEHLGLDWNHMSDLNGWSAKGAALYGVCFIPSTIVIDPSGIIRARNMEPAEVYDLITASEH